MKIITDMDYFPAQEELVDILLTKNQNDNRGFFRLIVAYYFAKMASMMRTRINSAAYGNIDVNFYGVSLAASGSGKGNSTTFMEEQVINQFRKKFQQETFIKRSEGSLVDLALERSSKNGTPYDETHDALEKEFHLLGPMAFSFDSGTSPAVKQMRHKLLMAKCGSINMEIDEIGSNLVNNTEVLSTFLELFDGKVKQKLIKSTSDNKRNEEIEGRTPTNMLLYGTPSKLLNGGNTESEFISMCETGYARRSFFGYIKKVTPNLDMTAEDIYKAKTDKSTDIAIKRISDDFGKLAELTMLDQELDISKDVELLLINYEIECKVQASHMKDYQELEKAEITHRYYKVLKLAGAYAFIEGSPEITEDHIYAAIKMAEDSGKAFHQILRQPKSYERIALFLADMNTEVTETDLAEHLPFYRGSPSVRKDLINQAIAWGYRNNIVIRTSYIDNIELFKGESLQKTDLDKLKVSVSEDITYNYQSGELPFDRLHELTTMTDHHYTAHAFAEGHRTSEKALEGFNLLILDVDSGTPLKMAKDLLKDYTAYFATTKRHTDAENRYRIIMPLSHTLKLNPETYKQFMQNVFEWLPFDVDKATADIARKWECFDGKYYYQTGELVNALLFIPDTQKQQKHQKEILDHAAFSALERWFLLNASVGSRNQTLIKYAFMLVDQGYTYDNIKSAVYAFNAKLKNPLADTELDSTIMISVKRKLQKSP